MDIKSTSRRYRSTFYFNDLTLKLALQLCPAGEKMVVIIGNERDLYNVLNGKSEWRMTSLKDALNNLMEDFD